MGTDIHLAVEVRRNGRWERELPPLDYPRAAWEQEHPEWYRTTWFHDRNYRLFAVLADVRNGIGFAGVRTGESIKPIAMPRGLPLDMSAAVRKLDEDDYDENDISLGDHSFSWLTLAEIQAYNWAQESVICGVVPLESFAERVTKYGRDLPLRCTEHPYSDWSGGISGPKIVTLSAADALQKLDRGLAAPEGVSVYVQDSWATPLSKQITPTWTDVFIPALEKLGKPEDVRIVFGFDS